MPGTGHGARDTGFGTRLGLAPRLQPCHSRYSISYHQRLEFLRASGVAVVGKRIMGDGPVTGAACPVVASIMELVHPAVLRFSDGDLSNEPWAGEEFKGRLSSTPENVLPTTWPLGFMQGRLATECWLEDVPCRISDLIGA